MDLRTALLTVVLLGIGYAAGALATDAEVMAPDLGSDPERAADAPDASSPELETRAVPVAPASMDDIRASLDRIERQLATSPMAAAATDEKVVERITEVWKPALLDAMKHHQTARARTRLITLYEQKIADYEASKETADPRGPAFQGRIEDLENSIRDWRGRVDAFKAARTAAQLVDALVADPEARGHHTRGDALMIVYGDKQPD